MNKAFRAGPADFSHAVITGTSTIEVDFACSGSPGGNGAVPTVANSVYTNTGLAAMLVTETLADTNRYARSQIADRFIGAIGVLSALGGPTVALQTGGPLRTIGMLLAGSELAVRISAGILDRALSRLRAVPSALALDAAHPLRTRKVAGFRHLDLTTALDTSFALGTL